MRKIMRKTALIAVAAVTITSACVSWNVGNVLANEWVDNYVFDYLTDEKNEVVVSENLGVDSSIKVAPTSDFEFYLLSDGTYQISRYKGTDTTFEIPSSYNNKAITVIGTNAFYLNENIQKVVIPNSIIEIKAKAFAGCNGMKEVSIPASVTYIDSSAFSYCRSLEKIKIDAKNSNYNDGGTENCIIEVTDSSRPTLIRGTNSRTSLSGIKRVAAYAYSGCEDIKNMKILSNINYIGEFAFAGCTNLETVILPSGITEIRDSVFASCNKLEKVVVPETVTKIAFTAFPREITGYSETLTIYCYPNSKAEEFAERFDINIHLMYVATTPTSQDVTNEATGIKIKWNQVENVEGYRIYKYVQGGRVEYICQVATSDSEAFYTDENGKETKSNDPQKALTYLDTSVKDGVNYEYLVTSYTATEESEHSDNGTFMFFESKYKNSIVRLSQPTVKVENTKAGVNVTWSKVTGAKQYAVHRKEGSTWKAIYTVNDPKVTQYLDTNAKEGNTYEYRIKVISGKSISKVSTSGKKIVRLSQPKLSSKMTSKGIKIEWNKVVGAKGYYVYKMNSAGTWVKVKDITSASTVSYEDTKVKNGSKYKYTVKAYNGSYVSSCDKTTINQRFLSVPVITKGSNAAKSIVELRWERNKSATAYEVKYVAKDSSKTTVIKYFNGSTMNVGVIRNLKKGATYVFYVRAIKSENVGKSYSAWCAGKTIKIVK